MQEKKGGPVFSTTFLSYSHSLILAVYAGQRLRSVVQSLHIMLEATAKDPGVSDPFSATRRLSLNDICASVSVDSFGKSLNCP